MSKTYKVLCSRSGDDHFVIGITKPNSSWFYFNDGDVDLADHPSFFSNKVKSKLLKDGEATITIQMDADEEKSYFDTESKKFIYDAQELKTRKFTFGFLKKAFVNLLTFNLLHRQSNSFASTSTSFADRKRNAARTSLHAT